MAFAFRRLSLVAHIASSVGWLGSVTTFLALSLVGLLGHDPGTVRSAYLAMNTIGGLVVIPFSIASLATGLIQSLLSPWGLVRHYWVLSKLLLNLLAIGLLLLHQYSAVAVAARHVLATRAEALPQIGPPAIQLAFDAGLAVLTLLAAATFAVYKPEGLTAYGRRKLLKRGHSSDQIAAATRGRATIGRALFLGVVGAILGIFVTVHLTGLAGSH